MNHQNDRLIITLRDLRETVLFGRLIGEHALVGDVILLTGRLGAGKTTLTQAIAKGLCVPDECYVTSPSFNLMNEYPGRLPLYHMDCYRLEDEYDVEGSGLMDYIVADGVTVIEWPERLGSLTPDERLDIDFQPSDNEERTLVLTPHGKSWHNRIPLFDQAMRRDF